MMSKREQRLLQDKAYAAYTRLNEAILAEGEKQEELLEEHETMTRHVLKRLEME